MVCYNYVTRTYTVVFNSFISKITRQILPIKHSTFLLSDKMVVPHNVELLYMYMNKISPGLSQNISTLATLYFFSSPQKKTFFLSTYTHGYFAYLALNIYYFWTASTPVDFFNYMYFFCLSNTCVHLHTTKCQNTNETTNEYI